MTAFSAKLAYAAALLLLVCCAWFGYRQHTAESKAICGVAPAGQKQSPRAMHPLNPVVTFLR